MVRQASLEDANPTVERQQLIEQLQLGQINNSEEGILEKLQIIDQIRDKLVSQFKAERRPKQSRKREVKDTVPENIRPSITTVSPTRPSSTLPSQLKTPTRLSQSSSSIQPFSHAKPEDTQSQAEPVEGFKTSEQVQDQVPPQNFKSSFKFYKRQSRASSQNSNSPEKKA